MPKKSLHLLYKDNLEGETFGMIYIYIIDVHGREDYVIFGSNERFQHENPVPAVSFQLEWLMQEYSYRLREFERSEDVGSGKLGDAGSFSGDGSEIHEKTPLLGVIM